MTRRSIALLVVPVAISCAIPKEEIHFVSRKPSAPDIQIVISKICVDECALRIRYRRPGMSRDIYRERRSLLPEFAEANWGASSYDVLVCDSLGPPIILSGSESGSRLEQLPDLPAQLKATIRSHYSAVIPYTLSKDGLLEWACGEAGRAAFAARKR